MYGSNPTYQICFNSKEALNLFQMFGTRYSLHKQVYTHNVVKAIELMIGDILILANDEFQIAKTLEEKIISKYVYFTDSLLLDIPRRLEFRSGDTNTNTNNNTSPSYEKLKNATQLLTNLEERKLYKFVSEATITEGNIKEIDKLQKSAAEYLAKTVDTKDFAIVKVIINFAMPNGLNPLLHVRLFHSPDIDCFSPTMEDISNIYSPMHFEEASLRVFSKNRDMDLRRKLSEEFTQWAASENKQVNTPCPSGKLVLGGRLSSSEKPPVESRGDIGQPRRLPF